MQSAQSPPSPPEPFSKDRLSVVAVLLSVLLGVGALLGSFHAYAVAPTIVRVERLEAHAQQEDHDRAAILTELQRVEDRLGNVGSAVHRIERRVSR